MALAGSLIWEVRADGNAANGGGFDPVSGTPGTDYSQQAAAQIAYTDLVIDGTTNTDCTSAANPFTSAHVGNIINVTGGTGFTVQRVQVMSVAAGVARCDKSLGTLSSTGGTGNLGGAFALASDGDAVYVPGNLVYVRSGTYTLTATQTFTCDGAVATGQIAFVGYNSAGSRSDIDIAESVMPLVTSATNSVALFTINGCNRLRFRNFKGTHTAATRGIGVRGVTAANTNIVIENCVFDGCLSGIADGGQQMGASELRNMTVRNSTSHGFHFTNVSSNVLCQSCWANANAGTGFWFERSILRFHNCISSKNTGASGHGWFDNNTTTASNNHPYWLNCVAYDNAASGWRFAYTTGGPGLMSFDNCIGYGNDVYNVSCATAGILDGHYPRVRKFALGAGGTGDRQNFRTGEDDITLTADPFTDAANGDYSLNGTTGGGALLRGLGWPAQIGAMGATTANYVDAGASQAPSGGGLFSGNTRGNMQ